MVQLTAKNLSIGYEGKPVLEGLDFTIQQGDCLCIVGENGAGKSTLMKTLLGLKASLKGTVERSSQIQPGSSGYLPQQREVQRDFPASVREIVLSGFQGRCGLRPFYTKQEKQAVMENLRRMAAEHLADRCYRELSGGQQQRVLLARALCASQSMLLLDEPVAGLDPTATAELYRLIQHINQKDGITVVMISHDIQAALPSASHVLHLGKKTFFGTVEEYRASALGQAFVAAQKEDV